MIGLSIVMENSLPTQLVTHARPHLDDVAALWLLQRFHPGMGQLPIQFIPISPNAKSEISETALAVGIGRGQFDEHKGDIGECAASLVWKWLVEQPSVELSDIRKSALSRMVEWVRQEDLGQLNHVAWREWSITIPIENYWTVTNGDNQQVYELGAKILDGALVYFEGLAQLDEDWKAHQEFSTQWGAAVALESSAAGVSQRVYGSGAVLVVQIDPQNGSRQFRADAGKGVDLTEIYEKLRLMEPDASWFLHHSKQLLLCGSRSATVFTPSKLTLSEMIDLVKQPSQ